MPAEHDLTAHAVHLWRTAGQGAGKPPPSCAQLCTGAPEAVGAAHSCEMVTHIMALGLLAFAKLSASVSGWRTAWRWVCKSPPRCAQL